MSDSDDDNYYWCSESSDDEEDSEAEEEGGKEIDKYIERQWNEIFPKFEQWTKTTGCDKGTKGNTADEFSQFVNWHAGMPPPCPGTMPPTLYRSSQHNRNQSNLRNRKLLCLHYFSNMLGFSFDAENEDVHPLHSIKEWNDIKEFTAWADMLLEHVKGLKLNAVNVESPNRFII